MSLYGTELWERLTPEQRIELGKHEACSVASVGLWFETLLMQRLLKDFYAEDPTTERAQWALTEVADECRHSQMFARMVGTAGVEPYGRGAVVHQLGKLFSVVNWGPAAYASILVAEEVLDRLQREQAEDESIQPLMRQVNRIHIMEEARHVAFARDEVTRGHGRSSRRSELAYQRFIVAFTSLFVVRSLINPKVYAAVGIDPKEGRRAALANPHHREMIRFGGEKIMAFLDEAGMIAGPGRALWTRSFLLETLMTRSGATIGAAARDAVAPSRSTGSPRRRDRAAGRGSGAARPGEPTLVLVHGWSQDLRTWDRVVDDLRRAGVTARILRYDHRGHGGSDVARRGRRDDRARRRRPRRDDRRARPEGPVVLAGHSMGGMTLMALAERHPDLVPSGSSARASSRPPATTWPS